MSSSMAGFVLATPEFNSRVALSQPVATENLTRRHRARAQTRQWDDVDGTERVGRCPARVGGRASINGTFSLLAGILPFLSSFLSGMGVYG